jgi:hypothetical protein
MVRYLAKGITGTPPVAELDKLADGEVLDVPGSPRVVHAPGHTAGSCALFVEDRSILFSGDALVTLDVARGPHGRAGPQIVRGPHTADADLAVQSLDVLAATNAQQSCPATDNPGRRESKAPWTSLVGRPSQRHGPPRRTGGGGAAADRGEGFRGPTLPPSGLESRVPLPLASPEDEREDHQPHLVDQICSISDKPP